MLARPSWTVAGLLLVGLANMPAATAVVVTSGCSNAGVSCTLQELAGGATIGIDDALFSGWTLEDFSVTSVALDDVDVVALDSPTNPGLRFEGNDALSAAGFGLLDLGIVYELSLLGGNHRFVDNSLELTGFEFPAGNVGGTLAVFEDVFDAGATALGSKFVLADNRSPASFQLSDSLGFAPQSGLQVSSIIQMVGDDPGDLVRLDAFEQRFSLRRVAVPAPPSLGLLALGLVAGLLAWLPHRGASARGA